nr:hypothetical protein [Azospirillum sp. INR13]
MFAQAGERNGDDLAVLGRADGAGARAAVQQRYLADGLARRQQGEPVADVAALLALQDLEAAGEDEEERVAGIALFEQKLALGILQGPSMMAASCRMFSSEKPSRRGALLRRSSISRCRASDGAPPTTSISSPSPEKRGHLNAREKGLEVT